MKFSEHTPVTVSFLPAGQIKMLCFLIEKLLIDHCEKEGIEIRKPKRGKRQ